MIQPINHLEAAMKNSLTTRDIATIAMGVALIVGLDRKSVV